MAHESLMHTMAQGRIPGRLNNVMPRFKSRAKLAYVIAFAFKARPVWLVLDSGSWGIMQDEEFAETFRASNDEARQMQAKIAEKREGYRAALREAMYS